MPRVASLYLPHLAIERILAAEARANGRRPEPVTGPARSEAQGAATTGWRPGARWARSELAESRAEVVDAIESLPAHRRPPIRELGRRSEAAPPPFRPARADEAGALRQPVLDLPPHVMRAGRDAAGAVRHPRERTRALPVPAQTGGPRNDKNGERAKPWASASLTHGDDLLVRQTVREFATMPDRGRWDRDAGSESKRTTTRISREYDLAGAFWQSPHAIAGEIREGLGPRGRWDDPAAFAGRSGGARAPNDVGAHPLRTDMAFLPRPGEVAPKATEGEAGDTSAGAPLSAPSVMLRMSPPPGGRGDGMKAEQVRHDADEPAGPSRAPLVTTAREGQKVVVAAACPLAAALGLAPGMALTFARALVPGLDVRDADPAGDADALRRLAIRAAHGWSPVVGVAEDGLWIDMSAAPLFGGETRMAGRILRWLARRGFSGRIAVAGTLGAAHALARHARGQMTSCPSGEEAAAVAGLPVAGLRIDGDRRAVLHRLGIETIGQLLPMPRGPLARRFGAGLVARLDQLTGARGEGIAAVVPPERLFAACRFAEPIATADAIATALSRLMGELVPILRERGRGARRLALVCRRVDGRDEVATIGTARPTREARHLLRLLEPKIETIDPGFGIEAMRLEAWRSDPLGAQAITDLAQTGAPDLAPLIDLLAGRLGARRLYRLGGVESDVPERSVAPAAPLGGALAPHPDWARPARLLDPPEAIDHVMAELPDLPPRRFSWRGRLHTIAHADGPERLYGEWWRRTGEAEAVRDYFAVEDESGRRFWLYRRGDGADPRTGDMSWHVQGLFG